MFAGQVVLSDDLAEMSGDQDMDKHCPEMTFPFVSKFCDPY